MVGNVRFLNGSLLGEAKKMIDRLTSNIETQVSPPSTPFSKNIDLAGSTSKRAFAMQRRASEAASGWSLKVEWKAKRVFKLSVSAITSDPEGSLPRVFTANRACAASARVESQWVQNEDGAYPCSITCACRMLLNPPKFA